MNKNIILNVLTGKPDDSTKVNTLVNIISVNNRTLFSISTFSANSPPVSPSGLGTADFLATGGLASSGEGGTYKTKVYKTGSLGEGGT